MIGVGDELLVGHLPILRFLVLELVDNAVQNCEGARYDGVRLFPVGLTPALIQIVDGECHLMQEEVGELWVMERGRGTHILLVAPGKHLVHELREHDFHNCFDFGGIVLIQLCTQILHRHL